MLLQKTAAGLILYEPRSDPRHEIYGVSRGLGVSFNGLDMVGEGMGIGGVIGLVGRKAVFPLASETVWLDSKSVEKYNELNGISLKYLGPLYAEPPYKTFRTILSPLYIRHRSFRPLYTLLMVGRTIIGLKSHYVRIRSLARVKARYILDDRCLEVEIAAEKRGRLSMLVANELSGRLFTAIDVDGKRRAIPPWMEVKGPVSFLSPKLGLAMSLEPVHGCRMFVGREVLGNRLDWAGLSYQIPSGFDGIRYRVFFEWLT